MKKRFNDLYDKIKILENNSGELNKYIKNEYLIDENTAIIKINIHNNNLYNSFSCDNQIDLNEEIYDFIDKKSYIIPTHYNLKLNFIDNNLTKQNEKTITKLISKHYYLILQDKKLDLKINSIKTALLFILGAVVLIFSYIINNLNINSFILEMFSIIATFSLWEAANSIILERKQLKIDYLNAGQLALSKVEFIEEKYG